MKDVGCCYSEEFVCMLRFLFSSVLFDLLADVQIKNIVNLSVVLVMSISLLFLLVCVVMKHLFLKAH